MVHGHNPRVAAIICIAEPGWSIIAFEPQWPVAGGAHGYDYQDPEMLALFVAANAGLTGDVGTVANIEVHPLLMTLIGVAPLPRSEEHTTELQSLMRISYAVFCLKHTTQDEITRAHPPH